MKAEAILHTPSVGLAAWDGTLPASPPSVEQARRYCESLARNHYENFHVATRLLPPRLRTHFYPVYAYCRWADDLGDETGDPARSLQLLDRWEEELDACYRGEARHPVFVALRETIAHCRIPPEPFHDLITAFRQDQTKTRYPTFPEVLEYCRYSANPVGRLVLYVCGYGDPELQRLSDFTCTALQLANFWQDVSRDYRIGRIYIPLDAMARHGYSEDDLAAGRYDARFAGLLRELVDRTRVLFLQGLPLIDRVDRRLAVDIELFSRGGMEILRRIERQNYNVLARRPALDSSDKALLLAATLARHIVRRSKESPMADLLKLSANYCRRLARARARNFYYGFLLLPKARREAFYAIYAFMRYCDDVADGAESASVKAARLEEWKVALQLALEGKYGDSLILPAFHAAVRRYSIPTEFFYELIAGAEMDLGIRSYRTFADLYQYCYRVASVVGLCSLHILGFQDPAAKKLAEECGIAFQLTNILRDLAEDAQAGRIYLPLEDLERFHYSAEELAAGVYNAQFLRLMQFEIERAKGYYERASGLIEMVEPESRPALWTLVSIYRGILSRIERNGGNVFSRAAALTRREKIEVLLHAAARQVRQKAGLEPGWQQFRA